VSIVVVDYGVKKQKILIVETASLGTNPVIPRPGMKKVHYYKGNSCRNCGRIDWDFI